MLSPDDTMAYKLTQEEQFQRNTDQFRKVEQRAQRLENIPRPLTREERQFLEAYNVYRPAIQQMLKVAELGRSSQASIDQMRHELEANIPSRTKEIFTGTVSTAVGALSFIGHPFVQIYETCKGKEVVTLKDTVEVMGEAGKYLRGDQTKAWSQATFLAIRVEVKLDSLYTAYNNVVSGLLSGDPNKLQKAKYELGKAVYELKDTQRALSDLMDKYRPELEQLGGFFDLSKKFLKDAAVEVAITLAAVKGLELVGKGLHHVLPKLAEKTAEKIGALTGGIIRAERVVLAGERAVQGVATLERFGHQSLRLEHAYKASQEIDHVANENADVHVEPIAMR